LLYLKLDLRLRLEGVSFSSIISYFHLWHWPKDLLGPQLSGWPRMVHGLRLWWGYKGYWADGSGKIISRLAHGQRHTEDGFPDTPSSPTDSGENVGFRHRLKGQCRQVSGCWTASASPGLRTGELVLSCRLACGQQRRVAKPLAPA